MRTVLQWRPRRLAIGAGVVALAVAGSAGAFAASSSNAQANATGVGTRAIVSAVTGDLGISAQQLRSDLAGGQTLSQIASADGSSASQLEQTILGVVQSRLEQALGAGKLTSQQEQALLTRAGTLVDRLVTVTHPVAHLERLRIRLRVVRFVARYVGITPGQLRSQIAGGSSLSQIVSSSGKSASGLEQALLTAARTRLDAAVGAGKISPAREQALLTRLSQRLDQLLGQSSSTTTG